MSNLPVETMSMKLEKDCIKSVSPSYFNFLNYLRVHSDEFMHWQEMLGKEIWDRKDTGFQQIITL